MSYKKTIVAMLCSFSTLTWNMERSTTTPDPKELVLVKGVVPHLLIGFVGAYPFLVRECAEKLEKSHKLFIQQNLEFRARLEGAYVPYDQNLRHSFGTEQPYARGTRFSFSMHKVNLNASGEPLGITSSTEMERCQQTTNLGRILLENGFVKDGDSSTFRLEKSESFPVRSDSLHELIKSSKQEHS